MLAVALITRALYLQKTMNENKSLTIGKVEFEEKAQRKNSLPLASTQLDREEIIAIVVQDLQAKGQIYEALLSALKHALRQQELRL